MKAIVYKKYGPPDVLELKEIDKPVPGKDQVLVKVYAASINSWDWDLVRGKPYIIRLWGLTKPRYEIPGADIAGKVEAVGTDVKKFKAGDEVFGDLCESGWGGFAEYVCPREKALTLKPANLTFEEAAAIPQAGGMALKSIQGNVKPGHKVLINGAGGGVGTIAVQLAKSFGAEVTGVDSTQKMDKLRSLGADHTIDYTREDFTKNGQRYDLIVDVVAKRSIFEYKRVLNPCGIFLMVGGSGTAILQAMFLGPLISKTGGKKLGILTHEPNKDLDLWEELVGSGKVKPVIDRSYPIGETTEAFQYFGSGQVQGKVIITM